jgi:hypothetical protein
VDEFRTGTETAFRQNAAGYFRQMAAAGPAEAPVSPAAVWRDLDGPDDGGDDAEIRGRRLSGRVSIFDEAARHDPRLGHDLLAWRAAAAPLDPAEGAACRLGRLAGTAAFVFEAGARAAREQGYYASSLMDFRQVQERLAGLVLGAELVRLGACRLCRLIERGETERAVFESKALQARAGSLEAEVRSVAGSVLGPSWVAARLPAVAGPIPDERIR